MIELDDTPLQKPADEIAVERGWPLLPFVDPRNSIGYEHIRYVCGYTEEYVKRYALAYAAKMLERMIKIS